MMLTCSEYTTGYLSEKSNGIWCEHLIVRVVKRKGGKMKYINKWGLYWSCYYYSYNAVQFIMYTNDKGQMLTSLVC